MRAYDIILKKRNGGVLSTDEIEFMAGGYARGEVPDSQMAAFLMAVYFRGMTPEETSALTMSMVRSGRTLDLSRIPGRKVDKHSTGGVGDKTTLVLVPLLAEAGLPVVKMSGRSLGHTGGTLDKLESIPGFRTDLTPEQMVEQVKRIGAAIAGQSADLVPADKKIYALRDLTATVESIPLIASSVMSKKIAAGADAIVLDVKAGSGAFMKTVSEAQELARTMVEIGRQVGRQTAAVISDMAQPLGNAVGNALEVREAIETLKGYGPDDLVQLCAVLGGMALVLGNMAATRPEGEQIVLDLLASGRGADRFRQIIEAQGGDPRVIDDPSLLPQAPVVHEVMSPAAGYVHRLDAYTVAETEVCLGGCRGGASPDLSVGILLERKIGDLVAKDEVLAEIHARDEASARQAEDILLGAYGFAPDPPSPRPLVHEIMD